MPGPVLLIHHAANRGRLHPPSSIQGLRACLDAGARVVEVDITPLADDFALLHGQSLEDGTTGSGQAAAHTAPEVRRLCLLWHGLPTSEPVGLLSQAVETLQRYAGDVELQLDLKARAPLTGAVPARLAMALRPVRRRVRVSSMADWALRRLRAIDPELPLGFDPLLYLDAAPRATSDPAAPPVRLGAYDYWDDHPLASRRWGDTAAYLAARAEALWAQAPSGAVWYLRGSLLAQALDDGFDWIAYLHGWGAQAAAWTLNAREPAEVTLARRLAAAGVDRITTDDAPALAEAMGNAEY